MKLFEIDSFLVCNSCTTNLRTLPDRGALVAPYRAILRYYRCYTPYRAIPMKMSIKELCAAGPLRLSVEQTLWNEQDAKGLNFKDRQLQEAQTMVPSIL